MEYDFYELGKRSAKESLNDLAAKAKEIEKMYGKDAKMEFELGIAVTIPVYQDSETIDNLIGSNEYDVQYGTKRFGKPNWRNNSYFGGNGASRQFTEYSDGSQSFHEPEVRKK